MYFYKWRKSHFTRLETVSTEIANNLFAYTAETFAIVVTVTYSSTSLDRTVLNVYILTKGDELKLVQKFYLDALNVFPITMNDGFYFYSVSKSGMNPHHIEP